MANVRIVAIDTESVGLGPGGKKSAVAQVSLIDRSSGRIYNSYIRRSNITDYRTKFSGLTRQILNAKGRKFWQVKKEVMEFLGENCILVGHSLHHDLRGLGIARTFDIRDTSEYWRFRKANNWKTPGLAFLASHFLKRKIRMNGRHSCVEDARTALQLYELVEREWETQIRNSRQQKKKLEYVSDSEYDSYSEAEYEDYGPFALNNDFW